MELQVPRPPLWFFAQFMSQHLSGHCSEQTLVPLLQIFGRGNEGGEGGD